MSLEHVADALAKQGAAEPFMGVIGVNIFVAAKAIIDYSTMTLYLMQAL